MGTHASIGILDPDGSVRAIYVHYDGYAGRKLLPEFYPSVEDAEALVALGDLRFLPRALEDAETLDHEPWRRYPTVEQWAKDTDGYRHHYLWTGAGWRAFEADRSDYLTWSVLAPEADRIKVWADESRARGAWVPSRFL